jgi:hypothetical protein
MSCFVCSFEFAASQKIKQFRDETQGEERPHTNEGDQKVSICIRKRPINAKEVHKSDHDIVTCLNPRLVVHNCKTRVDGITKFLDNQVKKQATKLAHLRMSGQL